jgi:hypothetical protein
MSFSHLPPWLSDVFDRFAAWLDRRTALRLPLLLLGALLASGRLTATSWFQAAGIVDEFRPAYHALYAARRRARDLALTPSPPSPHLTLTSPYGKRRIDLAKRAGHTRGWQQVECEQYGRRVTKAVKTFLATWRPAGGPIRVVLVREEHGWVAFFCTDPGRL